MDSTHFWRSSRGSGHDRIFWPGHVVEFEGTVPTKQPYPHASEDVVVERESLRKSGDKGQRVLAGAVGDSVVANLNVLFGRSLQRQNRSAYVPLGTKCPSLGAIEINRKDLQFSQKRWNDKPAKLRAILAKEQLDLSVTSTILRGTFSTGGVHAVEQSLPKEGKLHLRMGLARPFGDYPDQCFLQINGIFVVG
jgi:hypothetical protein